MNSNKKYIQFLSGILAEGKHSGVIINKIGMSKYLSDDIEDRFEKYAIWVADSYRKYITKLLLEKVITFNNDVKITKSEIDSLFKSGDEDFQDFLSTWWQGKYRDELYGYVYDWLRGRNSGAVMESDKLDFKNLTAIQAYTRAVKWHKRLESIQTGEIVDENGDVFLTFPDGHYWIKLNSSKCDDEAKAMGHCGTGEKGGNLFSLRKNKRPVVTLDLTKGIIKQAKGKANTKPKKEYHKYITEFILSDIVKGIEYNGYRNEDNFHIKDLEDKYIDEIISKKISLLNGQNLEGLKEYQTKNILKNNSEIFPINDIVGNDLSEEVVRNKIQEICKSVNSSNYSQMLEEVLEKFKKSGEYFSGILVDEIKKSNLIFEMLKDVKVEAKPLIKLLLKHQPQLKDYIKELFLKNKDIFKVFAKDANSLLTYISTIVLRSVFGNDGLNMAVKVLENPEVKKIIAQKNGLEYYEAMYSSIKDEVVSK